jgi:hypothetical protein
MSWFFNVINFLSEAYRRVHWAINKILIGVAKKKEHCIQKQNKKKDNPNIRGVYTL